MSSFLKSTVAVLGLLAGVAATAHAQSVTALPPASPASAPTATAPAYSSVKIYPDPGGSVNWQHQPSTATGGDKDPARQPYSPGHFGPAPN